MLVVTGTILYWTERYKVQKRGMQAISARDALVIGLGQALAIVPGLSRSGTTIAMGLFRGLDRDSSARFSFLLAIPAILGALVFSLDDLLQGTANLGWGPRGRFPGCRAHRICGHSLLLDLVKGRLIWFSYYTWLVGALILVMQLA